jgi:hypothetical protein
MMLFIVHENGGTIFEGNEIVMTSKGYYAAAELEIGDLVFLQQNEWASRIHEIQVWVGVPK